MRSNRPSFAALGAAFLVAFAAALGAQAVPYDIVYVRQARFGDNTNTTWPEVFHPARIDPGADLMLLHPDGSEEVLVAGGNGAVTDPFLSFDAQWCYYSLFPDVRASATNYQRGDLPYAGADIYRIHLGTRQIERLTHQEFTPNTGAGNWHANPVNPPADYNRLGYGILNLGPCPLPGGRIAFTSNRNGFIPTKGFTNPCLQLFVMDEDGANVELIAPMNLGSALHPTILQDGRIMFSSYESQGLRDSRVWGIWAIWPDGRAWRPIVSAFRWGQAFHFMTQLGNSDLIVCDYYNLNNNGFGALYRMPVEPPAGQPAFYSAFATGAPAIRGAIHGGLRVVVHDAVSAARDLFDHAVHDRWRFRVGADRRAVDGEIHAPERRARQRLARGLDAGAGERSQPADARAVLRCRAFTSSAAATSSSIRRRSC